MAQAKVRAPLPDGFAEKMISLAIRVEQLNRHRMSPRAQRAEQTKICASLRLLAEDPL